MEVEQPLILQNLLTSDEESDLLKSPECNGISTSGAPSPTIENANEQASNCSYKFDVSRTSNGDMCSAVACDVRELSDRLAESVAEVAVNSSPVDTHDGSTELVNSTTNCGDVDDLNKIDSSSKPLARISDDENCDGICVSEVSGSSNLVSESVQEEMDVDGTVLEDNVAISETLALPLDDEILENEIVDEIVRPSAALSLQTNDGTPTQVEPNEDGGIEITQEDDTFSKTQSIHVDDELILQTPISNDVSTADDTKPSLKLVSGGDVTPSKTPSLPIIDSKIKENDVEEDNCLAISEVSELQDDGPKTIDVDLEENDDVQSAMGDVSSIGGSVQPVEHIMEDQENETSGELVLQIKDPPQEELHSGEAIVMTVDEQDESVPEKCDLDGMGIDDASSGLHDNGDEFDKVHDNSLVLSVEENVDSAPNFQDELHDENPESDEHHQSALFVEDESKDENQSNKESLLPIASEDSGTKECKPEEFSGVDIEVEATATVPVKELTPGEHLVHSAPAVEDTIEDTSRNQDSHLVEKHESNVDQSALSIEDECKDESQLPKEENLIPGASGESKTPTKCKPEELPVVDPDIVSAAVVANSEDDITDHEVRPLEETVDIPDLAVPTLLENDVGSDINDVEILDVEVDTAGVTTCDRIPAASSTVDSCSILTVAVRVEDSSPKNPSVPVAETIGKKRRASAPLNEALKAAKIAKGRSSLTGLDEAAENEGFAQSLKSLKHDNLPVLTSEKGETGGPSPRKTPDGSTPATIDSMVIDLDDDDPVEMNEPVPKTTTPEPAVNGHDNESPDPSPTSRAAPIKDGVYSVIDRLFGDKNEITIKKKLFKKIIQTCFAERIQALAKTKAPPLQQAILAAQKCNQLQKSVFNFEGQREDTKVLLNKLIEDRRAKKTWDETLVPPRATRSVGLQVCINGKLFLKQTGPQNSASSQIFSTELTTKDLSDEMQRKAGAQQRQTLSQRERVPVRKAVLANAKKSTTSPNFAPRLTNGTMTERQPGTLMVTTAGPGSQLYAISPNKSTFSLVKPVPDNILSRVMGSPNSNSFRQSPAKGAPTVRQYQSAAVNNAKPVPVNIVRTVVPSVKTAVRSGPSLKTPNTSQSATLVSTPTQTPKPQPSASTTIDLTDDDAASARPAPRTPSQTPVTSTGSARKSTSMRNSMSSTQFKPIRPKLPPKAVGAPLKTLQNGTSPQRSKAFPSLPPNPPNYNPATAPPKPHLGICNTKTIAQGIMLTWHFNGVPPTRKVTKFQVFAYQESKDANQGISDDAWKKVGDVNALPLPMACTLTQFREGFTYHFIVRAVDEVGEVGLFSTPNTITLMRKT